MPAPGPGARQCGLRLPLGEFPTGAQHPAPGTDLSRLSGTLSVIEDLRSPNAGGTTQIRQARDDGDNAIGPVQWPLLASENGVVPRITARPDGLSNALLRGSYMKTVAVMEHNGIPIDTETLARLRTHWTAVKTELIREVDRDYGVYDGDAFRAGWFDAYLASMGICNWPRSDTGKLLLDRDTFKSMTESYPFLRRLRELRVSLSELRLEKLQVGPDGRNRLSLFPFGASTGRNTPPSTKFIFGPSTWLRSLIKPAEGKAVAYIDWSSQEIWVAAYLSNDPAMLAAVESGDPYLAFAVQAGLAPEGATKQSHGDIRSRCKAVVLGVNYGMRPRTLASRTGVSIVEAQNLVTRMERTFPVYTEWVQRVIGAGIMRGSLSTCFGWTRLHNVRPEYCDSQLAGAVRRFRDVATGVQPNC